MYYLGLGVEKDQQKVTQLVNTLLYRYKVTWFAEIAYSQKEDEMHFLWMSVAARYSNLWLYVLATLYEEGKGVEQDYKKAYELYESIIDTVGEDIAKGRATVSSYDNKAFWHAYGRIGVMYYYGKYVAHDAKKAFTHLELGAKMVNNSDVMLTLAYCYRDGIGTEEDMNQYHKWLQKAEEAGNQDALQLGRLAREECPDLIE